MRILMLNGSPDEVLPKLRKECCDEEAVSQLDKQINLFAFGFIRLLVCIGLSLL